MSLSLILSVVIALVLSALILKLLAKTFKFILFIIIFVVIFGLLYFGYDALSARLSGVPQLEPSTVSSDGCSSDSDCAFVTSVSDCNLVVNSCNNLRDSSKFYKPSAKVKCSIDSVVLNPEIACSCKKSPSGSYCGGL